MLKHVIVCQENNNSGQSQRKHHLLIPAHDSSMTTGMRVKDDMCETAIQESWMSGTLDAMTEGVDTTCQRQRDIRVG